METSTDNVAQLTQLATQLSAQAERRDRDQETAAAEVAPMVLPAARRRAVLAAPTAIVLITGVVLAIGVLLHSMSGAPAGSAATASVPKASTTTAHALGSAAAQRIIASGQLPGAATCLAAYAADAAASPLVLPSAVHDSVERQAYVASCAAVRSSER